MAAPQDKSHENALKLNEELTVVTPYAHNKIPENSMHDKTYGKSIEIHDKEFGGIRSLLEANRNIVNSEFDYIFSWFTKGKSHYNY